MDHVDVTVVNEHLVVVGHLALHIAEVDVGNLLRGGVGLDGLVDIHFADHLGDGALAELRSVGVAWMEIKDFPV